MISDKLTKALRENSQGWNDLINAISSINQEVIEPLLNRARSLSSLFEMNEEDINTRMDEMGSLMRFGQIDDVNKPLVIQQRMDEIHDKKNLYPLSKTLLREFGNKRVRWQRLYAPVDFDTHPYGSLLVTDGNKRLYPQIDEWIRVSRGVIESPIADFYEEAGGSPEVAEQLIAAFQKSLEEVVIPLVPLNVVFDGQVFTIFFDIREKADSPSVLGESIFDSTNVTETKDSEGSTSSAINQTFVIGNDSPVILDNSKYRMDCLDIDVLGLDVDVL